jgi:chemotaxis protein CheX
MTITHEDLVALVRGASEEVFSTMLALELQPTDAYVESSAALANNGVVSFIGLAGSWVGTGSISCSATLACQIAGALMMCEYTSVNEEVLDAVAEVTNMIMGNVKTTLEDKLGPMGLSIPTVVYGRNFSSRTVGKQEWSVVPFKVGAEDLEVQVCLAPSRDAGQQRLALLASGNVVAG